LRQEAEGCRFHLSFHVKEGSPRVRRLSGSGFVGQFTGCECSATDGRTSTDR